jgi:hypothetical protein
VVQISLSQLPLECWRYFVQVSMIPGAVTIAEVEENLELYKDKELVAYW